MLQCTQMLLGFADPAAAVSRSSGAALFAIIIGVQAAIASVLAGQIVAARLSHWHHARSTQVATSPQGTARAVSDTAPPVMPTQRANSACGQDTAHTANHLLHDSTGAGNAWSAAAAARDKSAALHRDGDALPVASSVNNLGVDNLSVDAAPGREAPKNGDMQELGHLEATHVAVTLKGSRLSAAQGENGESRGGRAGQALECSSHDVNIELGTPAALRLQCARCSTTCRQCPVARVHCYQCAPG